MHNIWAAIEVVENGLQFGFRFLPHFGKMFRKCFDHLFAFFCRKNLKMLHTKNQSFNRIVIEYALNQVVKQSTGDKNLGNFIKDHAHLCSGVSLGGPSSASSSSGSWGCSMGWCWWGAWKLGSGPKKNQNIFLKFLKIKFGHLISYLVY